MFIVSHFTISDSTDLHLNDNCYLLFRNSFQSHPERHNAAHSMILACNLNFIDFFILYVMG